MAARRALTVGVTRFDGHEDLDFAAELVGDLGTALSALGYDVRKVAAESLHGRKLGELVTSSLGAGRDGDLSVVHLVSHGENVDGDATVYALGSDGGQHGEASVGHWLETHQNTGSAGALFLLDLCSAGVAARLPWQDRLDGPLRGWVIAACGPREAAYDGRFTRAVTTVLRELRTGELDIDPSTEFVPLSTIAGAIRREVNRLAAAEDGFHQQVTASRVDISSAGEPPFFPNPAYRSTPRVRLRATVDSGVLPFLDDLDEGLDARHFVERATGLGGLADATAGTVGCFTGRDRELRRISPWLSGHGGTAPLYVVTGGPGSGKSALLGVLVCAASTQLRGATEPIWNRVVQAPIPIGTLAAVHARQRGLAAVTSSIARQLGLPESVPTPELVPVLRARGAVVVVDALDEADDPARIMNELLLPLVEPGEPVRLLVGVRRYDDFAPLFARATMVDLDEVEQHVLENDLHGYVTNLLRATPVYRALGAVSGAFASAVSVALAAPGQQGPFLVAGLYTRHFVTAAKVTDPEEAAALGRKVPADIGGVLDLDLELQQDQPWLRPVMTALAHARGAGMPVSLLTRVAPVFAPGRPTVPEIRAALTAGKFYLRQSLDSDHSNVYRLFHQGLADTLTQDPPHHLGELFDAMVSRLGPPGDRDWDAAEPYLFRHIADHAADADRVAEIETDPGLLLHPGFSGTHRFAGITGQAELALAAVRARLPEVARRAANIAGRAPLTWQPRWVVGRPGPSATATSIGHATSVAITPDGSGVAAVGPGGFQSWWWPEGGTPVTEEVTTVIRGHLVAFSPSGEILVARPKAVFRRWRNGYWWAGSVGHRIEAAVPDRNEPDFLCVTSEDETVRLHPTGECTPAQRTGILDGEITHRFDSRTTAQACDPGGTHAAVGCEDGSVHVLDGDGIAWGVYLAADPIVQVALTDQGRRIVAVDAAGRVHYVEDGDGHVLAAPEPSAPDGSINVEQPIATSVTLHTDDIIVGLADGRLAGVDRGTGDWEAADLIFEGPVRGVRLTTVGNEEAVLVATRDHFHLFCDGTDTEPLVLDGSSAWAARHFEPPVPSPIVAGGRLVRLTTDGDLVLVGDLESGATSALGEHHGHVVVHTAYIDSRPLAFTGGEDGVVRVWDLDTRQTADTLDIGRPVWWIHSEGPALFVAAGGELLRFDHVSARTT